MGKRIVDEFTERQGISRQRRWQLRKLAAGKCKICGRKRVNAKYCRVHRQRINSYNRKLRKGKAA